MTLELGHFELWSLILPIAMVIISVGVIWRVGGKLCDFLFNKYIRKIDQDYVPLEDFQEAIAKVYRDCHDNRKNCLVVTAFERKLEGMSTALLVLVEHGNLPATDRERAVQALLQ